MGEVYQARGLRLERDVAVKILSQQFRSDPDRIARFDREARALAPVLTPQVEFTVHLTRTH